MIHSIDDETEVRVTVGAGIACSEDHQYWLDYDDPSGVPRIIANTIDFGECFLDDPRVVGPNYCCPTGFECLSTGVAGEFNCEPTTKKSCKQFDNQADCETATSWIPESDIESIKGIGWCKKVIGFESGGIQCTGVNSCFCNWDTVGEKCDSKGVHEVTCKDPTSEEGVSDCIYSPTTFPEDIDKQCSENDFLTISWTAVGTGDFGVGGSKESECQDATSIIACDNVVKLPFFNIINLVGALTILLFYYIFRVKKE